MISISFSGLDGTGKSTQIELLEKEFTSRDLSVKSYHLFSPGQSVMGSAHQNVIVALVVSIIRRIKKYGVLGSLVNFISRLINVTVDSFITVRNNSQKKHLDVIIYDRYFYDVLVCIAYDFPSWKKLVFFIVRIVPKPDVIIVFDADIQAVINRKREHTLESAAVYRNLYLELCDTLKIQPIWALDEIDTVAESIRIRCLPIKQ